MAELAQHGGARKVSMASELLDERGSAGVQEKANFDLKQFMPERINQEISKRYEIDAREIGSGGYGKVFVAKDRETRDRLVAIKKVIVFDEEKRKAFQREALIMKELDHPNICKLLETYIHGRFMYFVMEYCEGREVFDRIMDQGMIAEAMTADIVRQCSSAVNYAHKREIAHRDLKPENVCFCTRDPEDTTIKVIDWGLGFYFGQARMSSAVGSMTYAAPEVLETRDVEGYTSTCDLWSIGVLTYVMLCGKPPFWGNCQEQLKRMKKETFPMSDSTWQAISKDAKDFIRVLLKNNPKERMPITKVIEHPWLKIKRSKMNSALSEEVMANLKSFSQTSQFLSLCIAGVARQLDHRHLREAHKVFSEMDTDGDGVLSLKELRAGFEEIYGKSGQELKDVEVIFDRLDLDKSGTIDYTEFCAACMGERAFNEESSLYAAFKAFDVQDDDGTISRSEICQVLGRCWPRWSAEVCNDLADELFLRYDKNGDGSLDFNEFAKAMREIAKRDKEQHSGAKPTGKERELMDKLEETQHQEKGLGQFDKAYGILVELDRQGEASPGRARRAPSDATGGGAGMQPPSGAGTRAISGSLQAMNLMRSHTPACFTCTPGQKDSKCEIM